MTATVLTTEEEGIAVSAGAWLGGKRSDFQMGPGTAFAWQHDARHQEEGRLISIFDNSAAAAASGPAPR